MKRKTILKHDDFMTPKDCMSGRCEYFVINTKPAKFSGDARYGIVVTKKKYKLAVHRNRVKRVLRDWIAFNEDLMNHELDYIFIANDNILDVPRDVGREKMRKVLNKIAETYQLNAHKI